MILSIGFDPFIQNVVHYVPYDIEDLSAESLLASTQIYDSVEPTYSGSSMSSKSCWRVLGRANKYCGTT